MMKFEFERKDTPKDRVGAGFLNKHIKIMEPGKRTNESMLHAAGVNKGVRNEAARGRGSSAPSVNSTLVLVPDEQEQLFSWLNSANNAQNGALGRLTSSSINKKTGEVEGGLNVSGIPLKGYLVTEDRIGWVIYTGGGTMTLGIRAKNDNGKVTHYIWHFHHFDNTGANSWRPS